jgi:hypothetical protein
VGYRVLSARLACEHTGADQIEEASPGWGQGLIGARISVGSP